MPVIVHRGHYSLWLDPGEPPVEKLDEVLKSYPASEMQAYAVSRMVNKPEYDSPELIRPVA